MQYFFFPFKLRFILIPTENIKSPPFIKPIHPRFCHFHNIENWKFKVTNDFHVPKFKHPFSVLIFLDLPLTQLITQPNPKPPSKPCFLHLTARFLCPLPNSLLSPIYPSLLLIPFHLSDRSMLEHPQCSVMFKSWWSHLVLWLKLSLCDVMMIHYTASDLTSVLNSRMGFHCPHDIATYISIGNEIPKSNMSSFLITSSPILILLSLLSLSKCYVFLQNIFRYFEELVFSEYAKFFFFPMWGPLYLLFPIPENSLPKYDWLVPSLLSFLCSKLILSLNTQHNTATPTLPIPFTLFYVCS